MSHRASRHPSPASVESTSTVRKRIAQVLREVQLTAREVSAAASVREHDVAEHLRHLEHSLLHEGEQLLTEAPHCIQCGFAFGQRERPSRPRRCPCYKSERRSPPRFKITRRGA